MYLNYLVYDANQSVNFAFGMDYVIDAASNAHPKSFHQDSIGTLMSNVLGVQNLLDYCAAQDVM